MDGKLGRGFCVGGGERKWGGDNGRGGRMDGVGGMDGVGEWTELRGGGESKCK